MKTIPTIILSLLVACLCVLGFTAGYYKCKMDNYEMYPVWKTLFSIVDSNGHVHMSACQGYELINADTVELCEGKRIPYKQKSINVKQK